ncbi:tryptophan--tRNA ligase [Mycoplasma feriruminatoris]|uniref:Tryptophan--tRNA ligase n=1 Tax=Mycoplasma feriruminatoris TaxID=1179777 RepID=A0A654INF1_9MOLU|nr:tryptophan--tRNA ligase [Mycoplasma feriruminatoris]WFQ92782.1 Tryptophan--tRNA ligase [Mycoplasma feriruminatoris]WFQ93626.1 tryptophanyl-tRNA synthetase [Mycoplasma feriruminatoris]WFQ94469.1 Tryptophan--tRNA ligase [Mycoplasma feriruminatoris]WFQ95293.1 tryptophanyl-tRNA synthetase [Mycoplasma feriruminatoris]WFQ96117.1 tryptophanyl-tRNA synthetase [Mycoplasma feriruminatoris]
MEKEIMVSGITPSGTMTLGNYLGVIKRFIKYQEEYNLFIFIANLHAITIPQEKEKLRKNTKEIAALYFACGLDINKTTIFLQSDVLQHAQLGWILTTNTSMGELSRMTQFKDKSLKAESVNGKGYIPTGLFTYPALMAADILLYDPKFVPVGIDQKQHIEITRDIAIRMNNKYGEMFKIPEPLINSEIKIMDLQDPSKKMSKSSDNPKAIITMLDSTDEIKSKIKAAVTDSENLIKYDPINKPGVSNLITIYCQLKNISIKDAEKHWENKNYKDLKDDVSQALIDEIIPIQTKFKELYNSKQVEQWLELGANTARNIANKKLNKVQNLMGLNYSRK